MRRVSEQRGSVLGTQRRWVLAAAVVGALVVTGLAWANRDRGVSVRAGGQASPPTRPDLAVPSPSAIPVPVATAPATAARIVGAESGDIWLYEAATGERRPLTRDGETRSEYLPRFHGPDRVTFVVNEGWPDNDFRPGVGSPASVIREVDLRTGRMADLASIEGGVGAHDWSPDGMTLALLGASGDGTTTELRFLPEDGDEVVRSLAPVLGRGGFINYDESRVEWAPDGRHLLVLETALDTSQDETLYVLRPDGTDAIAPRAGTWARWSADAHTIYCLCALHPGDESWAWQAIDTGNGVGRPLLLEQAMRPSLSPDGRFLAFDDGEDTPAVHVLELSPGSRPRRVTTGAIAPLWLDSGHLAVTDTEPCPDDADTCMAGGHGSMFLSAGTASAVNVASGQRTPIAAPSTDNADVAYGQR